MKHAVAAAAAVASLFAAPASAAITIHTAKIANGEVVISGTVRPRAAKVTLVIAPNSAVDVVTNKRGRFTWSGTQLPPGCAVEIKAGEDKRTALIAGCGPQGPPGQPGQNGITAVYVVRKSCWVGSQVPGQVPPSPPPMCELACNANDLFLSSACGEGEILGPADRPNGFKCRAFAASIVCGRQ